MAQTRTLAVSAGTCRDTDLVQAQAAFAEVLKQRLGSDAVDARALLAELKPSTSLGLDELEHLVEAAKGQFYDGKNDPALAQLNDAIAGLEKTTPSPRSWRALASARVLQGLVLKAQKKKDAAAEAFRRVLRVAPALTLNANDYSPSTVAVFEAARKELKGAKRFPVSVDSQPAGADVFIDGAPVGKTPYAGTLPSGSYTLMVVGANGASFPRALKVERDASAQMDLAFEASVAPQLPLCVEGGDDEVIARAVKLGARAAANNVVLLHVVAREGRRDWLEAALYDVKEGTRTRAGGMRLVASRQSGSLDALAAYILTGQGKGPVVTTSEPVHPERKPQAEVEAPPVAESHAETLTGTPTRPGAEPAVATSAPSGRGAGPRIAGIVLAAVGAGTAVAGIVLYATGSDDRDTLTALEDPDGNLPPQGAQGRAEADALKPKVDGNTAATIALTVGGGVLAVAGAILAIALPPEAPQVSVAVTPNGVSIGLSGRF